MREIKYKAWHKDSKVMFVVLAIAFQKKQIVVKWNGAERDINLTQFELMQFTGLKDKNGVEIYEGDVLGQDCKMVDDYSGEASIETLKLPVRWSDKKACWTVYSISAPIKDDWNYIPSGAYVMGNIYENANLLKS